MFFFMFGDTTEKEGQFNERKILIRQIEKGQKMMKEKVEF